jgi:hypothetical protein
MCDEQVTLVDRVKNDLKNDVLDIRSNLQMFQEIMEGEAMRSK